MSGTREMWDRLVVPPDLRLGDHYTVRTVAHGEVVELDIQQTGHNRQLWRTHTSLSRAARLPFYEQWERDYPMPLSTFDPLAAYPVAPEGKPEGLTQEPMVER